METRKSNGVIDVAEDIRDYKFEVYSGVSDIKDIYPSKFQVGPYTPKNQKSWMACVGFAISTILEAHYGEEFSPGWIYGRLRNQTEVNPGMIHSEAIKYLKDIGGVPESVFDVITEMPDIKDICKKFPELETEAKKWRISGYVVMDNGDTRTGKTKDLQIKKAITDSDEPLFAISPKYFGGSHAVTIIGWNDSTDSYIIQNSWGENWGGHGDGTGEVKKSEFRQVYKFLYEPVRLPFTDINETDWFYDYVKQCYMSGLIKGKTNEIFDPYAPITRAEACVMFCREMDIMQQSINTLNKLIAIKHELNQLGDETIGE